MLLWSGNEYSTQGGVLSENMPSIARTAALGAWLAAAMVAIGPAVVSYKSYRTGWDDLSFLHRAVSLHRAVWNLDARQWAETFALMTKSPLMALLATPWGGSARAPESLIGLALFSLAMVTWATILACLYVVMRLGVSWWLVLAAALSIGLDPMLTRWAGMFMADALVSWTVLLLLLLVPREAATETHSTAASVRRGLLWGAAISMGILAKVTFWPFLALAGPVVVYLRFRRGGLRAMAISLGVGVAASAPAMAIVIRYGRRFADFAWSASSGDIARFFASPHQSYGTILLSYGKAMGAASYLTAGLLAAAVAATIVRKKGAASWYPLLLLGAYGVQVTTSLVRDPRYFLPVAVGLPFLLAVAASRVRPVTLPHPELVFAGAFVVAALVSWPMHSRIDLRPVHEARALLEACRARNLTDVVLASDSSTWNFETFLLARELMGGPASGVHVETLVYSAVRKKPLEEDLAAIERSDAVIIEEPAPAERDAVNVRWADYRADVTSHGERMEWEGERETPLVVYRMER